MIGANEVKEFCLRKPACVVADGVDGVGNAAARDFPFINLAMSLSGQGQPQEAEPKRRGRGFIRRLERRSRRWNEKQARQFQFLPRRLRHQQMAEMNRIKRTAK